MSKKSVKVTAATMDTTAIVDNSGVRSGNGGKNDSTHANNNS